MDRFNFNFSPKSSDSLNKMSFKKLMKYAENLKENGYKIKGISKLEDTPEGIKELLKLIKKSQENGVKSPTSSKPSTPTRPTRPTTPTTPDCKHYKNKTECKMSDECLDSAIELNDDQSGGLSRFRKIIKN